MFWLCIKGLREVWLYLFDSLWRPPACFGRAKGCDSAHPRSGRSAHNPLVPGSSPGVVRSLWRCRTRAGLRYQSEGTYISLMWRGFGGYPWTPPWDPRVFSSVRQLAEAGLV